MKQLLSTISKKAIVVVALVAGITGVASFTGAPAYAEDCPTNSIRSGASCARADEQRTDLLGDTGIFTQITNTILFLVGAIAVIMLIIGGVRYTISGGDSKQVESAKNTIMYAIIGIVVVILAYAIVNFVIISFLGTSDS